METQESQSHAHAPSLATQLRERQRREGRVDAVAASGWNHLRTPRQQAEQTDRRDVLHGAKIRLHVLFVEV